jgi:hypothetical protein
MLDIVHCLKYCLLVAYNAYQESIYSNLRVTGSNTDRYLLCLISNNSNNELIPDRENKSTAEHLLKHRVTKDVPEN